VGVTKYEYSKERGRRMYWPPLKNGLARPTMDNALPHQFIRRGGPRRLGESTGEGGRQFLLRMNLGRMYDVVDRREGREKKNARQRRKKKVLAALEMGFGPEKRQYCEYTACARVGI